MPLVDLVMPKLGESIMEATILKWNKQPGDAVKQDETILEIATDKVDSEVPSITEGVIEELLFQVNDVVPIGAVIARIRTGDATAAGSNTAYPAPAQDTTPTRPEPAYSTGTETETAPAYTPAASFSGNGNVNGNTSGARFYSPLVLNIAASEGLPLNELEAIPGSGNEGRVTKKDILQYIADKKAGLVHPAATQPAAQQTYNNTNHAAWNGPAATAQPVQDTAQQPAAQTAQTTGSSAAQPASQTTTQSTQPASTQPARVVADHSTPPANYGGNVEIIEMDRMRKLIADHMVRSVHTSPHVTSISEADVTHLVHWRDKVKKDFEKRENTKLTFTPLFMEAVIRCIKKYPLINSSLDGDKIIIKKDINLGMATALPSGNLIVPVIRNADQLNLVGLARQVNTLADNARNGKLRPEDTQGGTFTLTNVGTFGSLMGTPIINQPQVAILAVGAIKKRPVVLETSEGDAIVIRHMMYLSLSYDHRIVDGSLGATFCTAVARELENSSPDRIL